MVSLADKAGILAELWINYRDDEDFADFIEYNDIGLPLAYYVAEGLVKDTSDLGDQYILETFDMFAAALEVTEEEIEELDEISLIPILEISKALKDERDKQ
jgi:hypothetical protein